MPQTTSYANACDIVLKVDDKLGFLRDVSGSSNTASLSLQRTLGELVTFSGEWSITTSCKISGTIALGAVYSTDNLEAREIMEEWIWRDGGGAPIRTVQINVPDDNTGSIRYQGEATIESYELPLDASSADPIAITAQLRTSGTWTRAVIAS
jgi:hypothetical protein